MADIFSKNDAELMLRNKQIFLFGDSNMRALYKDLICLLHEGSLINNSSLRSKLEANYMDDELVRKSRLHSGRDFVEERKYHIDNLYVEYKFITRCWCDVMDKFLDGCSKRRIKPDIIIMNSCLWDICRWGPNGVSDYKDNILKLMQKFRKVLASSCLVIWTTTLPVASKCKAAFLVEQVDFLKHSLHFDVMEANIFTKDVVMTHGFDVLDLHHYLRFQTLLRNKDGVHWKPIAVRLVTNLVLTHIALSWNIQLPGRVQNSALTVCINMNNIPKTEKVIKVPIEVPKREPVKQPDTKRRVKHVERNKPYHKYNNNHGIYNNQSNYNYDNNGYSRNKYQSWSYNQYNVERNNYNYNNFNYPYDDGCNYSEDNFGPIRRNNKGRKY